MRSISLRFSLVCFVALLVGPISSAHAQFVYSSGEDRFDRLRLTGLIWVGELSGTVGADAIGDLPPVIDVKDQFGISNRDAGWLLEGNLGAGKRHRLLFAASGRENTSDTTVNVQVEVGGTPVDLDVPVGTSLKISEFRGSYNLLVVANPRAELGLLAGIGYFDFEGLLQTPLGDFTEELSTPYPSLGGNLLVNPVGRVRAYAEVTGFPNVTVEEFTGSLLDFNARVELFPIPNLGLLAGYRSYHLVFDEREQFSFDLRWTGFIVGGQVRF